MATPPLLIIDGDAPKATSAKAGTRTDQSAEASDTPPMTSKNVILVGILNLTAVIGHTLAPQASTKQPGTSNESH